MSLPVIINGKKYKIYASVETRDESKKVSDYLKEKGLKFEKRERSKAFPAEIKIKPKVFYDFYVPE